MISLAELYHGHDPATIPADILANLDELLPKVNVIRAAWNKPMIVTSGYRTEEDQARINPSAPKSKHTTGNAVDISDPDLSITAWLKSDGANLLVEQGLYCEEGNSNWVHLQDIPPGSGHRWFYP